MNSMLRPGLVWGLAWLMPAVVGCHSLGGNATNSDAGSDPATTSVAPIAKADPALARTEFRKEVTPLQQFNVHVELGRAQESQEHYAEAVLEYEKAIEACQKPIARFAGSSISPARQSLAHRRLGAALDHLGRFAQSEVQYRAALRLSPNDPKVWNDAGYSCYLQGRWDDAIRDFKMAEKLEPDNPRFQTNLGLVLAATGKNDEALAALIRAGGEAAGHANMAFLMASQGKTDLARKHYQTALAIRPDLGPARQALAALEARDTQERQVAQRDAAPTIPLPTPPQAPSPSVLARSVPPAPATPAPAPRSVAGSVPARPKPAADPSLSKASGAVVARPRTTPLSGTQPTRPGVTGLATARPRPAADSSLLQASSAVAAKPGTTSTPSSTPAPSTP
jgi:tetratricopeptide (TPR) repeat protein